MHEDDLDFRIEQVRLGERSPSPAAAWGRWTCRRCPGRQLPAVRQPRKGAFLPNPAADTAIEAGPPSSSSGRPSRWAPCARRPPAEQNGAMSPTRGRPRPRSPCASSPRPRMPASPVGLGRTGARVDRQGRVCRGRRLERDLRRHGLRRERAVHPARVGGLARRGDRPGGAHGAHLDAHHGRRGVGPAAHPGAGAGHAVPDHLRGRRRAGPLDPGAAIVPRTQGQELEERWAARRADLRAQVEAAMAGSESTRMPARRRAS